MYALRKPYARKWAYGFTQYADLEALQVSTNLLYQGQPVPNETDSWTRAHDQSKGGPYTLYSDLSFLSKAPDIAGKTWDATLKAWKTAGGEDNRLAWTLGTLGWDLGTGRGTSFALFMRVVRDSGSGSPGQYDTLARFTADPNFFVNMSGGQFQVSTLAGNDNIKAFVNNPIGTDGTVGFVYTRTGAMRVYVNGQLVEWTWEHPNVTLPTGATDAASHFVLEEDNSVSFSHVILMADREVDDAFAAQYHAYVQSTLV